MGITDIKFRGKAIEALDGICEKNGWVSGNLVVNGNNPFIIGDVADVDEEYFVPEFWISVIKGTVGQYVGMNDFDGNGIYEGDIVECRKWFDENIGNKEPDVIYTVVVADIMSLPNMMFFGSHKGELKVVGNIHDNPNLIPR